MKSIRLIRIAACLVLGIATMEVCARLEDKITYGAPFWSNYDDESLYTFDAMGKTGKPNASYLKWELNEIGYRGPALPKSTYRIACFGASETFGLYENEDGEWPRRLEHDLNVRTGTDHYEVVNVAYPGMSLPTMLRRVELTNATLHPQMAILYLNYASYISGPEKWQQDKKTPTLKLRITDRMRELLKSSLPEQAQDRLREWEIQRSVRNSAVMARLPENKIGAFHDDLNHIICALRKDGVRVVLLTHATRFGAILEPGDRKFLVRWRKFYPGLSEEGLLDMEKRMNNTVRDVAMQQSVTVVDTATLLNPGAENFVDYIHFTNQGSANLSALVATGVISSLQSQAPIRGEGVRVNRPRP